MKRFIIVLYALLASTILKAQSNYDLVIVGGTPSGIMTAISAAREGKTSVILERTQHIGGLPANGLGATDIATRGATTGLFKEFVDRIRQDYIKRYGENSQQVTDCSDGYHFEPSVAYRIFNDMLKEHDTKITILTGRQFDSDPANITKKGNDIQSIKILNRKNNQTEEYTASVFIDATYEGDLAAAAGVPFTIGREGRDGYNEIGAGKVYRYWDAPLGGQKKTYNGYDGYESDGTTFQGDNSIQAYNYRLCLTNDPANKTEIKKPLNYNREEYTSLIEDVWTGRNTGFEMLSVTPQMMEENRKVLAKGGVSQIPGDRWGIAKLTNMVALPNKKTDANNQHMAFISTDLPEENWPWPMSGWEWRDKFAQRLKDYTLGLIWFAQNDKELPESFRNECKKWGFAKDEYTDNDNFPRQVYVREGRRFKGEYFFTANDAIPTAIGQRPPLHSTSITSSHYALDSHAVLKREKNRVHLDGFISYSSDVYTVPYGVIVPQTIDNLFIPVPVSGSHIGFSTLRMEPCWMALGEAAGIASAQMINEAVSNRNIDIGSLQEKLIQNKATLIYYKDIATDHPDYRIIQYFGLRGYMPGWEAKLYDTIDEQTLEKWNEMAGTQIQYQNQKRIDVMRQIYSK